MLRFLSHFLRTSFVAAALFLPACDREAVSAPQPLDAGDIRSYVTPEIASQLSAETTFQLPSPPDSLPVSPDEAKELALVFARRFGPSFRVTWERQHGREIDFESLRVGSPAYYAETPFASLPSDVHPAYHNLYGPYYMVYLVSADGTPALIVAVAANTGAWIEGGRIRFPVNYGNDFYVEGVRLGQGFYKPLSPETAVRRASESTGARVAAVPELQAPDEDYHPVHARWKVTLDRPVAARTRGSAQHQRVREVYVGLRGEFSVPAAVQPTERFRRNSATGGTLHVRIVPGRPVAFEAVTLSGT
ncbi:MAG TPA: hypothetical protein VEQ60_09230 [Longimicrobium sp.]|nr:hypothetical protein [Longimicrobium sp.]